MRRATSKDGPQYRWSSRRFVWTGCAVTSIIMMRDRKFIDVLDRFCGWSTFVRKTDSCVVSVAMASFIRIDYGVFMAICDLPVTLVIAPCKSIKVGLPSRRIRRVTHR